MKLLLDTHLLIWSADNSEHLSTAARELLNDGENDLYFSAISIWEIAIKRALKKDGFDVQPRLLRRGLVDNGYAEVQFTSDHAFALEGLSAIHNDPFDRALIAQAISEGMLLLTSDRLLERYSGMVRRV